MHSKLLYTSILRPILFSLDAEAAHNTALGMAHLLSKVIPCSKLQPPRRGERSLFGLHLPNPVGLAAGLDKNAAAVPFFASLGFGHVEVGTVTPLPQLGNPRPRMFRLPRDGALINRMGFPSIGADQVAMNLARARERLPDYVIGVNIGKNKETPIQNAKQDYCVALRKLAPFASYITINVSSPNTPELRSLQHGELLAGLLTALQEANALNRPLCLKIAPDIQDTDLSEIVEVAIAHKIAALIATNTTLQRPQLSDEGSETGGLSGAPLFPIASRVIREVLRLSAGRVPVIGVGGIGTAAQLNELLKAGVSLVQLYTALVFEGPSLVDTLLRGLEMPLGNRSAPAEAGDSHQARRTHAASS